MTRTIRTVLFLLALAIAVTVASTRHANARGVFQWGGETVVKIADFPDVPEYQMDDGTYVDAGFIYKSVSIVFCPVWNYDFRWAGSLGADDTYLPIEEQELRDLAATAGVTLPATPDAVELPFWNRIGGKLVVGGAIFVLVLIQLARGRGRSQKTA
jgi:hypothetical protein